MGTHRYVCPQGHEHEHLHLRAGNGRLTMKWSPAGELVEHVDTRESPPPESRPCPDCGQSASRAPTAPLFDLRSDATQTSGWHHPGMVGVDYSRGPDGAPARHLKGYDNATNPYDAREPAKPQRRTDAATA